MGFLCFCGYADRVEELLNTKKLKAAKDFEFHKVFATRAETAGCWQYFNEPMIEFLTIKNYHQKIEGKLSTNSRPSEIQKHLL